MPTIFRVNDRVSISSPAPVFAKIFGRKGTVINVINGEALLGPTMIEVHIDHMTRISSIPFYEHELINLTNQD